MRSIDFGQIDFTVGCGSIGRHVSSLLAVPEVMLAIVGRSLTRDSRKVHAPRHRHAETRRQMRRGFTVREILVGADEFDVVVATGSPMDGRVRIMLPPAAGVEDLQIDDAGHGRKNVWNFAALCGWHGNTGIAIVCDTGDFRRAGPPPRAMLHYRVVIWRVRFALPSLRCNNGCAGVAQRRGCVQLVRRFVWTLSV